MGAAALGGGAALLAAVAVLVALSLRLRSVTAFALAAYLVAVATLVGLAEALTPFHAVTSKGYLAGLAALTAISAVVWQTRGRPRPPAPDWTLIRELRGHPVVCVLGSVVLLAMAYELVVGISTPPNNWDSMWHHLVRVAAWRQEHAVDHVPDANTNLGINANPPNAELQILFSFVLLGRDTFATIPQFLAEVALLLSVFGIARRVGFEFVPSLFASLITASLAIVTLESVTSQNDLCAASVVLVAAYFALEARWTDTALAGLSLGLALGTKATAALALPVLGLIVFAAGGLKRLVAVAAASAVGFAAFGSFIYIRDLTDIKTVTGVSAGGGGMRAPISAANFVSTTSRVLYKFIDLSGLTHALSHSTGRVLLLLVLPAAAIAVAAAPPVRRQRGARVWAWSVVVASLVPAAAVVLAVAGRSLFPILHISQNPPDATSTGRFDFQLNTRAYESVSYFGPLGPLFVWPLAVAVCIAWIRRKVDRRLGALAAALPVYLLTVALTLSYTPFIGRYFIAPLALVMPLAAIVYRNGLLMRAVAVVAVAALILVNLFNEAKPIGLAGSRPIWSLSRADAQALESPAMRPVLERVASVVPQDAHVDVDVGGDDWSYPYYGSHLGRTVTYLEPHSLQPAPGGTDAWLIAHRRVSDFAGSWVIRKLEPTSR